MDEWTRFLDDGGLQDRLRTAILTLAKGEGKFSTRVEQVWIEQLEALQEHDFPTEIRNHWFAIVEVINFIKIEYEIAGTERLRLDWNKLARSRRKRKQLVASIFELYEEVSGIGTYSEDYSPPSDVVK